MRGDPPKLKERPSSVVACYGGWKGGLASANSALIPHSLLRGASLNGKKYFCLPVLMVIIPVFRLSTP
jgi:hypothetical protein